VLDTAFSGYGRPRNAVFSLLARDYEGVLTANVLARYEIPRTIVVRDTGSVLVVDSMPTPVGGHIVLLVDTVGSDFDGPLQIAAHALAEPWDPANATWIYRDSAAALLWAVPGGTPGAELATYTYTAGDSILLSLDSTALAGWRDTTDATRGVLVRMVDGTGRLRTTAPVLRVQQRSSLRDTVVTSFVSPTVRDFIYTPMLPTESSEIRSGGLPGWRTFLHFRSDLRDLIVSCGPDCTGPLHSFEITRAELVLQPTAPLPGFRPEVAIAPTAHLGLVSPEVPLRRSLLGSAIGTVSELLEPERFADGAAPVFIGLTDYLRLVVADSPDDPDFYRPEWLVLTPGAQTTFGFGTFAAGPRLRLVLSTAQENQLP
ncbi:MAG TPA: hypothetical protein VK939_12590, partial [Longimicrobiales bacterium]|nr:hypothetical protein [Longimicrobiales bacterium]